MWCCSTETRGEPESLTVRKVIRAESVQHYGFAIPDFRSIYWSYHKQICTRCFEAHELSGQFNTPEEKLERNGKADVRDSTVRDSRFLLLSAQPVFCRSLFRVAGVFTLQTGFAVQSLRTRADGDMLPFTGGLLSETNLHVKEVAS